MTTFRVTKIPAGWAIVGNTPMSTVYLSLQAAIDHANELADALKGHGLPAKVEIDEDADS